MGMTGTAISHFRVLEKLGQGGMGEVYKAEDTLLRRTVALKFLKAPNAAEEHINARFLREAQAGAVLDHPNICPVYGFEQTDGCCFIVMAFVEGTTLASQMRQGMVLLQALDFIVGIGEGLKYAHDNGIIHRDIKAANVLLTRAGVPRITDFGLARIEERSRITVPGAIMGTITCMAPEQLQGEDADRRTDIWALGILLYEMLTGRTPFDRGIARKTMNAILHDPTPVVASAAPGLPSELDAIVRKATSKSRGERYQYVDDFAADIRTVRRRLTPEQECIRLRAYDHEASTTRTRTKITAAQVVTDLGWPMIAAAAAIFLVIVGLLVYRMR